MEPKVIELARLFIGVTETTPNDGPLIRLFQKAVDGKAGKEPWCVGFIHFILSQVDSECGTHHKLHKTESALQLWERSPQFIRGEYPKPGFVAVWQHYKGQIPTGKGHVGFVVRPMPGGMMETIEGNTSSSSKIEREGDGIFLKERQWLPDRGSMKLLGFLNPYGEKEIK